MRTRRIAGSRGLTLVELVVVGLLVGGLCLSVTSVLFLMPHWHARSVARLEVMRESGIAARMLRRDLQDARDVTLDPAQGLLAVESASGAVVTYRQDGDSLVRRQGSNAPERRVCLRLESMVVVPGEGGGGDVSLRFRRHAVRGGVSMSLRIAGGGKP